MQHMFSYSLLYIIFINLIRLEQAHNKKHKENKERRGQPVYLYFKQSLLEEKKKERKKMKI